MLASDDGPAGRDLGKALADGLAALGLNGSSTIVELTADSIVVWRLYRDAAGTPHCYYVPPVPLPGAAAGRDQELSDIADREAGGTVMLVCSSPDSPRATLALDRFRRLIPDGPAFACDGPLRDLLGKVVANDPLAQGYELVVLRQFAGALRLGTSPLFPVGAPPGSKATLRIRCQSPAGARTAFAVVTAGRSRFRLLSVESARLPPGDYDIRAVLPAPGIVRFRGLPTAPHPDQRSWPQLLQAMPGARSPAGPPRSAHLVCAIETSGPEDAVGWRLLAIDQLVRRVLDDVKSRLTVSLVTYGPHAFDSRTADSPAIPAWAGTGEDALGRLGLLMNRPPAPLGYPRAAQLECVLTRLAERLDDQEGRPVVVIAGRRPAFPPRVDARTEILPCRYGHDWRRALQRLQSWRGIAFGAIRDYLPARDDPARDEDIWASLGSDALAERESIDVERFATDLGLLRPAADLVSLPLVEGEGD